MMKINEVSKLTGVSVRALHHYDAIGLLSPTQVSAAGYRLYDESALKELQSILLFRELDFSLKEIRSILQSPGFDRDKALERQIHLLELRRERLDNLIRMAQEIRTIGANNMNFEAFDTRKIDEYTTRAKEYWGQTAAYHEFEEKDMGRTNTARQQLGIEMMSIFAEFGKIKDQSPECDAAKMLAQKLQAHITANYYNCTDEIFAGLAAMYAAGGEFTDNIDAAGGEGTAVFAYEAINAMLASK